MATTLERKKKQNVVSIWESVRWRVTNVELLEHPRQFEAESMKPSKPKNISKRWRSRMACMSLNFTTIFLPAFFKTARIRTVMSNWSLPATSINTALRLDQSRCRCCNWNHWRRTVRFRLRSSADLGNVDWPYFAAGVDRSDSWGGDCRLKGTAAKNDGSTRGWNVGIAAIGRTRV